MKQEHKNSDFPGCTYCMEPGTPVKLGEICPKCGDKLPTQEEINSWSKLPRGVTDGF